MEKVGKMKELLEKAVESGTIWLLLASLVSADNNHSAQDCEKTLAVLEDMRNAMMHEDIKMEIETYNKIMEYIDSIQDTIEQDLSEFKSN